MAEVYHDCTEGLIVMKAAILYSTFFDHDGKEQMIGGIETYLLNLAGVCQEMVIEPTIYQWSNKPFHRNVDGIVAKGMPVLHLPYKKRPHALFGSVLEEIDADEDIVIFGSDAQSVRSNCKRAVSIQHGISWDLPARFLTSHGLCQRGLIGRLYKAWIQRRFIGYYERCPNRVCVDHNFLNWYRTHLVAEPRGRNWVIPNCAEIASMEQIKARNRSEKTIRILFARRFCEYRGTRIMSEAAKSILARYSNVEFTFAGEGPDEKWMKEYFADEARVKFLKYFPDEALDIHLRHHVAVVPSLASEGTSLAVVEAMGAGCAVVATAIGGITSMIIDGYNGLLVSPNVSELTSALERVIESPEFMRQLGENAYDVASKEFSLRQWQTRWRQVIETIANG